MFRECGIEELLQSVLQGYSATLFAYGQTGTGVPRGLGAAGPSSPGGEGWAGGVMGRALLEGEWGPSGQSRSGCRAGTGDMKAVGGGGFSRLEKRLGLVLGYGNAFGVESVQWGGGRGVPPPFKRFPGHGALPRGTGGEPGKRVMVDRRARLARAASGQRRVLFPQALDRSPPPPPSAGLH